VAITPPGVADGAGALYVLGVLSPKTFALTFDDGPNASFTPLVLSVLARAHVLATFFEIGREAQALPDLTRAVVQAGNFVGNHTFSHPYLTGLDPGTFGFQVDRTTQILQGITGRAPRCLRPPYGATNGSIVARLAARGIQQQMWTVDPSDYKLPPPDAIVANVLANAHPGGVVILHDGGGDRSRTVAALPMIIDGLRATGYTLVPVCY
jgi:peptidoglycan/xylan/chitin deacetylase (PgdA/CDA1 family)